MLFNSYLFIFIFFPLCITGFYAFKNRGQISLAKAWLIGCSLWFYGYYSTSYLLIMILSVVLNRLLSVFLLISEGKIPESEANRPVRYLMKYFHPQKRVVLITGVILNLVVLGYFKYLDFLILNLNFVIKTDFPLRNIVLPLGISFFTFQQIGYLVDVYRGEAKYCGFLDYALFVVFFPQLVAGPIASQEEMMPQFDSLGSKPFDPEGFSRGLTVFIMGLVKKVLIADTLGKGVDVGYSMISSLSGIEAFLVMLWYTLQLYFDFSGYCDMAMGLAEMLGIDIPLNFNSPYKSHNIVEFWKRWHMTLTRFFTKYVYIPLGGNRKGTARMVVNILIVYFLSGLWHGAGWNFVLWGMLHGIMYVIVRLIQKKSGRDHILPKPLGVILTFLYVNVCWVFFRAPGISEGIQLLLRMVTGPWNRIGESLSMAVVPDIVWYVFKVLGTEKIGYVFAHNAAMTFVTLIALVMIFACSNAHETSRRISFKPVYAVGLGLIFMWCIISLSGVSTFLYFNF